MSVVSLQPPFILFLGETEILSFAKTGAGLMQWREADCVGQVRLTPSTVDLGLPDISIDNLSKIGAKSLVIGVAPMGGRISDNWIDFFLKCIEAGLNVVNGLHDKLSDYPVLVEAAYQANVSLIDIRTPPKQLTAGSGIKRKGFRVLTVGTDCAVGKKYGALALTKECLSRGIDTSFCATGQTGIMIAERGLPLDAVPSDFIAGAVEQLSPIADKDHWDIIEGQGSLFHPAYAGVTLGLIHGAQPDAIVVCHDVNRHNIEDAPHLSTPSVLECGRMATYHAKLTNPNAYFAGVCLNTSSLEEHQAKHFCSELEKNIQLPVSDPIRFGVSNIVDKCIYLKNQS